MALSIVVRLRSGRYDAASLRPQVPEWPPAPSRVFCALVASARTDSDWSALSWLERAGAPQVWAAAEHRPRGESVYVVTNTISPGGGSQQRLGRSNGLRQRVSAVPTDDSFAMVWPDAEPDDAVLGRLVRLAARVPYVGRSTSSAEVTVVAGPVEPRQGWSRWLPTELGTAGAVELGAPYPGYIDQLRAAYDQGRRSWEVGRTVAYRLDLPPAEESAPLWRSSYRADNLIVLGFQRGHIPVGGDEWPRIAESLRQAIISRVAEPVPPHVSGHGAGDVPHVAYLGLPDVGHRYSDGHLLGVAVAVPQAMPGEDRRRLLRGVLGMRQLRFGVRQSVEVVYDPDRQAPFGLLPGRWTAGRNGATRWVTATPVMLDRYPKAHTPAEQLVADSLTRGGYPQPAEVQILPASPLRGGIYRPHRATIPAGRPMRPWVHCRVDFPVPVHGVVIAGAMRYLGGGLFVPEEGAEDAR